MRAVSVLPAILVLLVVAGCSQATSAPEQPEKEDIEQAVSEPTRVADEGPGTATVACSDFSTPQHAMDYMMEEATEEEKKALDANGNGFACDEELMAEASAEAAAVEEQGLTEEQLYSIPEEDRIAMGSCQMLKMQEAEGEAAVNAYVDGVADELAADMEDGEANQDVVPMQVELSELGYNCTEYLQ